MSLGIPPSRLDRLPVYLVAATFVVLAVLIGASVADFNGVASAQTRTSLFLGHTVQYTGLTTTGGLAPNGTLFLTLHLTIDNPSPRVLFLNTIAYKAWIRDGPAEAGLAHPARSDVPGPNGTLYYLVFQGSIQVTPYAVPAGANVTYPYTLNLTKGDNPFAFQALENITAFFAGTPGGLSGIPWIAWSYVSLDIEGVPPPAAGSAAEYLLNTGRLTVQGGTDLGP